MIIDRRKVLALVAAAAPMGWTRTAVAGDGLLELVTTVKYGDSYKLRIHAAVLLAKTAAASHDPRAIPALAFAAGHDAEESVRVLAVQLLARNPGGDARAEVARIAISNRLADSSPRVRQAATEALRELKAHLAAVAQASAPTANDRSVTRIRIAVGRMGGQVPDPVRDYMRKELLQSLRGVRVTKVAVEVADMSAGGEFAYIVDGTIKRLSVLPRSGEIEADCAVDLLLSKPPRGILLVASGEANRAKAQVSRPGWIANADGPGSGRPRGPNGAGKPANLPLPRLAPRPSDSAGATSIARNRRFPACVWRCADAARRYSRDRARSSD